MELFGSYTSPYVRHCRIVLMQLGQAFTFVPTDNDASAQGSPTMRVPYLKDGDRFFGDSSTILMYARSKVGRPFLDTIEDAERYFLTNTCLEASVNLFLLEKDGITPAQSSYLARHAARVKSVLDALNAGTLEVSGNTSDGVLRAACFLGWTQFRKRIDLAPYPNLVKFLEHAAQIPHFAETAPFVP